VYRYSHEFFGKHLRFVVCGYDEAAAALLFLDEGEDAGALFEPELPAVLDLDGNKPEIAFERQIDFGASVAAVKAVFER
jgi:hypothetical protein